MSEVQEGSARANGAGHDDELPRPALSPVEQRVQSLVEDFQKELGDKRDERATIVQRHEQELAGVDRDIKVLSDAIAGLTGKPAPALKAIAKRKRQPGRVGRVTGAGTATGFGVSLEAALVGSRALKKMIEDKVAAGEEPTFTQKEFYRYEGLDWDQSKGSQAVRFFRQINFLRKAGRSNETGAELWAIMDADAVEREVELAEKRTEEYERRVLANTPVGDSRDRVLNYLSEHGEIVGLRALADVTAINRGSIDGVVKALEEDNLVAVERPETKGKPLTIRLGDAA